MNNTSPFSFLESIASRLQPPSWLVDEGQQKIVLFLNHVLMQEKEAQSRLLRKKGSVVHLRWGAFALDLLVTPAGLTDRALPSQKPDLVVSIAADAPWTAIQSMLQGERPAVKIEGDVQLAAELAWLSDNLRWDVEEDLSRIVGDPAAHALAGAGRRIVEAIRAFIASAPRPPSFGSGTALVPTAGSAPANGKAGA